MCPKINSLHICQFSALRMEGIKTFDCEFCSPRSKGTEHCWWKFIFSKIGTKYVELLVLSIIFHRKFTMITLMTLESPPVGGLCQLMKQYCADFNKSFQSATWIEHFSWKIGREFNWFAILLAQIKKHRATFAISKVWFITIIRFVYLCRSLALSRPISLLILQAYCSRGCTPLTVKTNKNRNAF